MVYPIMVDVDFATIADESTQIGDKTPTVGNPSVAMSRYGGMAYISNNLINLRSPQIVDAVIMQGANANARFIDLASACFSVTTNSDPFNGLIFDANTAGVTAKALTAINDTDFINLIAALSDKVDNITFIANRKVRNLYGQIESTGGMRLFTDFLTSGKMAPLGHDFIENRKIPSTLFVNSSGGGTSKRTNGTSDVIIAADLSKLYLGVDQLRMDMSPDLKFDYDQTAFRFVGRIGSKVVSSTSTSGVVAAVLELTN
jgi:HK97 family phage major capsid protein